MTRLRRLGSGRLVAAMRILLLSLLSAGFLAGCDNKPEQRARPKASAVLAQNQAQAAADSRALGVAQELTASRPWRISFLMKNFAWANPYWRRTQEGAETARQDFGVFLRVQGVQEYAVERQIRSLDALIRENRSDGIIIAPLDTNRLSPVVEKAVRAGIPVIVYDTPLNAEGILTYVGSDNFRAGTLLGRWVVEQLGGAGNVLIMEGLPGHQNSLDRRNGMLEGLREGDINVLGLSSGRWQRADAQRVAADWLERLDDIDAIMAVDDVMALGIADALDAANRRNVLVTGFDANTDALLAIRHGRLHATMDQVPKLQARRAVQLMVRHLETGEPFPATLLWSNLRLVTAENVTDFLQ
uniref:sugar ABC transporter substrate-binding protein n=1 Tax=Marinobacterium profundum TaxID=1714300 RepID=UPI0009E6FFB5|nr:sugar ABC transporter substrate-binding protein [Marinobacterium profundum]